MRTLTPQEQIFISMATSGSCTYVGICRFCELQHYCSINPYTSAKYTINGIFQDQILAKRLLHERFTSEELLELML